MNEKQLQASVLELASYLGWKYFHPHNSRHSVPGYPDLTLVHPEHGIIWRELKTDKGRVSSHQVEWIAAINKAGGSAGVWNLADWVEGRVLAELKGNS